MTNIFFELQPEEDVTTVLLAGDRGWATCVGARGERRGWCGSSGSGHAWRQRARGRHLGVLSAGSALAAPIARGRERERELGRQAGSLVARAAHCQGLHGHGELEEERGGTAGLRCTQKVTRPLRLLKMVPTMMA